MKPLSSESECRRRLRSQMTGAESTAYFDHAAVAPLSGPAARRMQEYAAESASQGDLDWLRWAEEIEAARHLAAGLINARPTEVAWVANTTTGIGLVAEGVDWRPGDNVVTLADEFPSNFYPWLNLASRGVEVRRVAVENGRWGAADLLAASDERTRLFTVSWVGYSSGFRCQLAPLVEAAHRRGIRVMVDAIQGLGVFPLDVRATGVDFLAADGHKWMLGPEGAGLLYVAESRLEELRPLNVGWNSVRRPFDFHQSQLELRDDAARYEGGSYNMPGILSLGASLKLLRDCGLGPDRSPVADAVLEAAEELACRLESLGAEVVSSRGREHGSGIVSFSLPGQDSAAARRRCLERRVVLSCRNKLLRASPHAYCDEEDLRRLCDALQGGAS